MSRPTLAFSSLAIVALAVAAFVWFQGTATPRARMTCTPVTDIETLLARTDGRTILIDGSDDLPRRAAEALSCFAAASRQRVTITRLSAPRARQAPTPADLDARTQRWAASLASSSRRTDRTFVALETPHASRAPYGLSGETWRPLGARLADRETISLRVEASNQAGVRIVLRPFEDVPQVGAAARYDGLIEIGPNVSAPRRE